MHGERHFTVADGSEAGPADWTVKEDRVHYRRLGAKDFILLRQRRLVVRWTHRETANF